MKTFEKCLLVSTQCTNVTYGRTDRQAPHDSICRACAKHRAAKNSGDRLSWATTHAGYTASGNVHRGRTSVKNHQAADMLCALRPNAPGLLLHCALCRLIYSMYVQSFRFVSLNNIIPRTIVFAESRYAVAADAVCRRTAHRPTLYCDGRYCNVRWTTDLNFRNSTGGYVSVLSKQ